MIQINQNDIQLAGGLLSALSAKCAEYLHSLLPTVNLSGIEKLLKRHIVHTDPHLDEYFAELFFRSCLPSAGTDIEFIEESLYSEKDDFGAQHLWPEAVVFGIGRTVSSRVQPLLLFDEHIPGKGKTLSSCSTVVADYIQGASKATLPDSIQTALREVSAIDEFGNAHPQHLGNIIKTLHNVHFLFEKGATSKDDVRDLLDYTWKRALIDACIVAVIYALENKIDLLGDPSAKKDTLQKSLKHYIANSFHKTHPNFENAGHTITSNYGNQNEVFNKAILKDNNGKILTDSSGNQIPQLLILSRICYACYSAWGDNLANMIMVHFWEIEFQNQLNFRTLTEELDKVFLTRKSVDERTALGVVRCEILQSIEIQEEIFDKYTHQKRTINRQVPLWILNLVPRGDVFNANRPCLNYINSNNHGCGLLLLEDSILGTKALFKANSTPYDKWERLVETIRSIEPNCWYDPSKDPNRVANFINNGNKANQYVQRSALDLYSLCKLAKNIFK
ncbi:MAG: hypothetical protein KKE46_06250 [Gammaproteobacteria bacterium]|nr:hypothetical protein [Gammaproteobacteria bacterium]